MRIESSPTFIASRPLQIQPTSVATADPEPTTSPLAEPVAPESPATPTSEPTPGSARGMLERLAGGHFNPVAALRHHIKHADALREAGITIPEPATPPKGKAYAKFLEQYRAMQGAGGTPATEPNEPVATEGTTVDQAA